MKPTPEMIEAAWDAFMFAEQDGSQRDAIEAALVAALALVETGDADVLIRELVAALDAIRIARRDRAPIIPILREALTKAKAAGYEP